MRLQASPPTMCNTGIFNPHAQQEFFMIFKKLILLVLAGAISATAVAQEMKSSVENATSPNGKNAVITNESLPSGARIYIAPMSRGFESYVIAGLEKKKVPVVVVTDPDKADYELSGVSDSDKAGWAKMLFLGSQQTNEAASIKNMKLKTG